MNFDKTFIAETGSKRTVEIKLINLVDYKACLTEMRAAVDGQPTDRPDQIWVLQHPSVYTQGTSCDMGTLAQSGIEVVKTDRGGQITYHGPGQIVIYPLLTLKRYNLGVRSLVRTLEQSVINLLGEYAVAAKANPDAPGVYVDGEKIAALGLRIKRGRSYHGLSLNVDMDLQPFANIDPCGFQGLRVTQLKNLAANISIKEVETKLIEHLLNLL